tara:strand:+ start:25 stop:327 length:303 start_codon:yes stop_codon:yes gene_type:complete
MTEIKKKAPKAKSTPKAKLAAKKVDATQKAVIVKETVESQRVIKYNYPTDCKDPILRKSFRQTTRGKIKRIENKIFKAKSSTLKSKLTKELKKYKSEVLN